MRILFAILCSLFTSVLSYADSTSIAGTAHGAEGQMIRLMAEEDFISQKTVVLTQSRVDAYGNFLLTYNAEETFRAYLDINYQRTDIFLVPGKTYALQITFSPEEQMRSYYERQPLPYKFQDAPEDDLNMLLSTFNRLYNQFVTDNFNRIYVVRDKDLVHEFRMKIDSIFVSVDNSYFNECVRYRFAGLEQLARIKSKRTIALEYFAGNHILYNNIEYTYFFNEFFGQLLLTSPGLITISDLIIAVNDKEDPDILHNALLKTGYLDDERLRELVLLLNLRDIYGSAGFYNDRVIDMINRIGAGSKYPHHQKIVKNIEDEMNKLAAGSPAPNLKLTSIGGYDFQLKNIRSKPVLLMFFHSGQKITTTYLDELAEIYEKFKAGLEVISISMDQDPMAYLPLANSGKYGWSFAHYGNKPAVFDLYNIRDLPLFVLINADGNISMYPAPPPGEQLERGIMKVIH